MQTSYPYDHLWINGKHIFIREIVSGGRLPQTEFEKHTYEFIREWLSGMDTFILHTSGSTGTPKTITVTRSQMEESAKRTAQALGLRSGDHALVALDTRYIAGKMMLVRSFVSGMYLHAVDPCADPLEKIPTGTRIDFTALVPYQAEAILASKHPHLLKQIRVVIIGGAPISSSLEEKLHHTSVNAYQTYGMTETVSHIALKKISIGNDLYEVLPGVKIRQDARGCLVIQTPFVEEEVITNDIVEIVSNNCFRWTGRYDNVINSGGVKIHPEKLEEEIGQIFTRLNIKQRFFIYGIPDDKLGQRAVLVVEQPAPAITLIREALKSLTHSFSIYHLPKELYETAGTFILTPTQKINRAETFRTAHLVNTLKI